MMVGKWVQQSQSPYGAMENGLAQDGALVWWWIFWNSPSGTCHRLTPWKSVQNFSYIDKYIHTGGGYTNFLTHASHTCIYSWPWIYYIKKDFLPTLCFKEYTTIFLFFTSLSHDVYLLLGAFHHYNYSATAKEMMYPFHYWMYYYLLVGVLHWRYITIYPVTH